MTNQENQSQIIRFIQPDPFSWQLESEIHVWKFPVVATDLSLLTSAEKSVAARFRFEADKNRFAIGRQAVRFLSSEYLKLKPLDIGIDSYEGNKPVIGNPSCNLHFNISHSGEWVLIGFANHSLGIDIEEVNQDFHYEDLLDEHFSEMERSFINNAEVPALAFYYLWTRKEALTKAWGTGLQENLKKVYSLHSEVTQSKNAENWSIQSFQISSSYQAAIAYQATARNPIYLDGARILSALQER